MVSVPCGRVRRAVSCLLPHFAATLAWVRAAEKHSRVHHHPGTAARPVAAALQAWRPLMDRPKDKPVAGAHRKAAEIALACRRSPLVPGRAQPAPEKAAVAAGWPWQARPVERVERAADLRARTSLPTRAEPRAGAVWQPVVARAAWLQRQTFLLGRVEALQAAAVLRAACPAGGLKLPPRVLPLRRGLRLPSRARRHREVAVRQVPKAGLRSHHARARDLEIPRSSAEAPGAAPDAAYPT